MRQDLALMLKQQVDKITEKLSNKERSKNLNGETFDLIEIKPFEDSAVVIWGKNSGKRVIAWFFYNNLLSTWLYLFLSSSQALALDLVKNEYLAVERHNFTQNGGGC